MAKTSSVGIRITPNADGFEVEGGTTSRKLTLSGGNATITGGGAATITFPSSTGTLYATGNTDVALADGGTGASLTDPNADRIMFWDDSAGAVTWLTASTGLSISGTSLAIDSTVYRSGGTDVSLADGGTGASLTDPGADRILFWDDSAGALTWLTMGSNLSITGTTLDAVGGGGGGTTIQSYDYIVYKSGANAVGYKTSDGTTVATNSDASVVLQACVDLIDGSTNTGGRIYVQPGTYDMSTVVTVQGDNTTDSKAVAIHGAGVQATIFKPSVNVNAFTFSNRIKFSFKDAAIVVRGSGTGITTTNSTTTQRACWLSEIRNVYVYDDGTSTAHSGWGFDLGNFFRSVVENVDMNQVKNGIRISALGSSAFNPGDCEFTRIFIELQSGATSGTAINLNSNVGGRVNQMNFDMVEMIGTGTNQTAILLDGSFGNNWNRWTGINAEEFATVLDIVNGNGNVFDFNYIVTQDASGTTYFKTQAGAINTRVSCGYLDTYAQTVTIVNDANTSANERNRFEHIAIQGSAPTYTFTRTDATYFNDIFDNINGGLGFAEVGSSSVSANAVTINATSGSFTDTTDINAGATRTAITLTNQAIRSSSVVDVYMMSAPDTNAMIVGSAVPADGSATIYLRNVGSGNQTATMTIGFNVTQ